MPRLTFESARPLIGGASSFAQSLMRARQINEQQEIDAQAFEIQQAQNQQAQERQLMLDQENRDQRALTNRQAEDRLQLSRDTGRRAEEQLNLSRAAAENQQQSRAFSQLSRQTDAAGKRVEGLEERLEELTQRGEDLKFSLGNSAHTQALQAAGVSDNDRARGMTAEQLKAVEAFKEQAALSNPEYARHLSEVDRLQSQLEQAQSSFDSLNQRVLNFGQPEPERGPAVDVTSPEAQAQAQQQSQAMVDNPTAHPTVDKATMLLPSLDVNTPDGATDTLLTISAAMEDWSATTGQGERWAAIEKKITARTEARMAKAQTPEEKAAILTEAAIAMRDVFSEVTQRVTSPLQPVGSNNARSP